MFTGRVQNLKGVEFVKKSAPAEIVWCWERKILPLGAMIPKCLSALLHGKQWICYVVFGYNLVVSYNNISFHRTVSMLNTKCKTPTPGKTMKRKLIKSLRSILINITSPAKGLASKR